MRGMLMGLVTLPITVTPIISTYPSTSSSLLSTTYHFLDTTSTSTFTSTTVLLPATVTSPSTTVHPTVTVTPNPVTTTKTVTLLTLTIFEPTLSIEKLTSTVTATCNTPTKQQSPDPTATITPTVITAAAFESAAAGAKFRHRRVPVAHGQGLQERAERPIQKRAPGKDARPLND